MNRKEQNTWNALNNKPPVRPMEKVVAKLQKYMETYDRQYGIENYDDEFFIADVLYGLGAALDDKYRYANGFRDFKEHLRKLLDKEAIQK